MDNIRYSVDGGIAHVVFDTPDSKVNVLSAAMLGELAGIVERISSDASIRAVLFRSAKSRIFIAGADIREIENLSDAATASEKAAQGQAILNRVEDLRVPTVALINGVALGGGLEFALACTYRIAALGDGVRIGLPEVMLGIVPGFGGTWRLPARTGLQKGIELIVQGRTIDPVAGFKTGLVDAVAPDSLLLETALEFLKNRGFKKERLPRRRARWTQKLLENTAPGRGLLGNAARKSVLKATRGLYPAPLKAIEVILANYGAPREAALKREARAFGELVAKGGHKNLIHVFYLTERYKKEVWTSEKPVPVASCGILGSGIMGGGIAQLVTSEGIPARMKDVKPDAILLGLRSAQAVYSGAVKKRRMSRAVADARMGLITPTMDYSGFRNLDLVIEAVVEDMGLKKKVFAELDGATSPGAVLASNTSSLSIAEMASTVKDPSRVVGMHFFNPVHKMPLVEVIRGAQTSERAIAVIVDFSRRLKKTPIVVNNSAGFLVNRLLMPFLNEAGYLAEEGVSIEAIDRALLDFGTPMGAFLLMDEIGIDVGAKVAHILEAAFGSRMKACGLLDRMKEKGLLGKKTGKGFYIHTAKKGTLNPETPVTGAKIVPAAEIVARCISVMVNEASYCLAERVTREAADIDIGMILGTGFPPFRGGLMKYADAWGIPAVVETLTRLAGSVSKDRFAPSPLLLEMQKSGRKFYP